MTADPGWLRLVSYLDEWGVAGETPTGIEVTFEHPSGGLRTVQIVVGPAGWSEYIGVVWGVEDPADTDLRDLVESMPADQRFLVYGHDQWEAASTPAPPADPDDDMQPGPGGEWVLLDGDGNVTSRYADTIGPTTRPPGET